jgi:hypothetical protein
VSLCRLFRNATRSYSSVLMGNSLPHQEHISQECGPPCNDIALRNHHSISQLILPCHGPGGRPIVGLFVGRPGFNHRSVLVRFLVHQVAVEQFFVRVLRFLSQYLGFPLSVPLHQCSILHLHVALTRRTNERSLGTFQKVILSRKSGGIGQNRSST